MKVGDIMNRKVLTVRKGTPLDECISLMERYRIRHLLVTTREGSLIGVISERDIRGMLPSRDTVKDPQKKAFFLKMHTAGEAMTENPFYVTPDTPLRVAARIISSRKYGCLPVVENDKVVGILTTTDLLEYLVSLLEGEAA